MLDFVLETVKYYPTTSTIIGGACLILIIIGLYNLGFYLFVKFGSVTNIASLKPGRAEIKGRVKAITAISSKQRKACFYRKIEERFLKKKWIVVEDDEEFLPFKVVDETGEVRVVSDSSKAYDLRCELIKHSNEYRTKHYYLEEGDDVYILGEYSTAGEEAFIGAKDDGTGLTISNIRDENLLSTHSYYAISTLFIAFAVIGMSFYFAFSAWEEKWEGLVDSKYQYEVNTKFGLDSEIRYMLKMKSQVEFEVTEEYYHEAIENAYAIKHYGRYHLEIITDPNSPYLKKYAEKKKVEKKSELKLVPSDGKGKKKKVKKRRKKKIKPKVIYFE